MHLVKPKGRKKKYDLRFRNWDGRIVRLPGDRDKAVTLTIGDRVAMLVKAKLDGDPPPATLSFWIANLTEKMSARLSDLGLISARHIERNKPLEEQIDLWQAVVRQRNVNDGNHATQQAAKVRRVVRALAASDLATFDPERAIEKINGFRTEARKIKKLISLATRRSYVIATKDFTGWLAKKLKVADPLVDMPVPSPTENIEYERQPLTVKQFRSLMAYLDTFERYKGQRSRWTAQDRKLIYWTAVCTAYREKELMRLRCFNLYLNEKPPVVCLKARDTKNKRKGEIPIADDLAVALKKHIATRELEDCVFPFPATRGAIVKMFRRDLAGAGIKCKLPGGEVHDFHCLRSTAITWWLDVYGLPPKRVQILARLSNLALVQNYSRNLRIEDFGWLKEGPTLVSSRPRQKTG